MRQFVNGPACSGHYNPNFPAGVGRVGRRGKNPAKLNWKDQKRP